MRGNRIQRTVTIFDQEIALLGRGCVYVFPGWWLIRNLILFSWFVHLNADSFFQL